MRLALAAIVSLAVSAFLLFAFSKLYDSPFLDDGPAYPPQVSQTPVFPIHTVPRCEDAVEQALAAVNTLRSCTDASQCRIIVNHAYLPLMAINTSKKYQYIGIRDRLNRSCPSIFVDWFPPHGFEYTCRDGICDVEAKPPPPEVEKNRLIQDTLKTIEAFDNH